MSDKVNLPKRVVDFINDERYYDGCEQIHWKERSLKKVLIFEFSLDDVPFELFLQALVNGYEVEQTPEDKVRQRYMKAVGEKKFHHEKEQTDIEEYWSGYHSGIFDCLNDLNIKIEGVNAE